MNTPRRSRHNFPRQARGSSSILNYRTASEIARSQAAREEWDRQNPGEMPSLSRIREMFPWYDPENFRDNTSERRPLRWDDRWQPRPLDQ